MDRAPVVPLATRVGGISGALTVSAALVVWQTWPLVAQLDGGIPNALVVSDWYYTAWTLAWQIHAWTTGLSPAAANIYHPTPDALYYGPLCTGLMPYFAPAYLWSGNPLFAAKLSYLLALTVTGVSVHCVVWAWTRSWVAGAIGATVLLSCKLLILMPLIGLQWSALAFFAPLVWAMGRVATWRGVVAIALLAVAQCLAEPMYVAPVVIGVVGAAAGVRLLRRAERPRAIRLMAAGALSLVLLVPIMWGYVVVRAANPDLERQTMWPSSPDLLLLHPMLQLRGLPQVIPTAFLLLGMVTAVMVRRLVPSRTVSVPAGAWLDVWLLATVPIVLSIAIPAFAMLPTFAPLGALRVPGRLVLGGFVGMGLLGGLVWNEVVSTVRRGRGRWVARGLALVMVLPLVWYHVASPPEQERFEMRPEPPADASELALLRDGTGPVLELPAAVRDARQNARAMYRSLDHWRPVLNGYASFWPAAWEERMADAARLPDADALARLVRTTGLRTIVVHLSDLTPEARTRWQQPHSAALVPRLSTGSVLVLDVVPSRALAATGN